MKVSANLGNLLFPTEKKNSIGRIKFEVPVIYYYATFYVLKHLLHLPLATFTVN